MGKVVFQIMFDTRPSNPSRSTRELRAAGWCIIMGCENIVVPSTTRGGGGGGGGGGFFFWGVKILGFQAQPAPPPPPSTFPHTSPLAK